MPYVVPMTKTTAARRPFYAVRVTVTHNDGSTSTRLYSRDAMRLSRQAFDSFAVGDMLGLLSGWAYGECGSVTVEPATEAEVSADRARWGH